MTSSNQISPGMTITIEGKVYRIETSVKVAVTKGTPFIKTKLRDLMTDQIVEKNFKIGQEVTEVSLEESRLEFLYPEGKDFLFLDIDKLDQVLVPLKILGNKINYLKEGTEVKAMFYGDSIFSVELPQFLELMVIKTDASDKKLQVANNTKKATVETGAKIEVPQFIEVGDIIKVDTQTNEYIQRV
jgi:elongation factor P